jgi:hypothetical protein
MIGYHVITEHLPKVLEMSVCFIGSETLLRQDNSGDCLGTM